MQLSSTDGITSTSAASNATPDSIGKLRRSSTMSAPDFANLQSNSIFYQSNQNGTDMSTPQSAPSPPDEGESVAINISARRRERFNARMCTKPFMDEQLAQLRRIPRLPYSALKALLAERGVLRQQRGAGLDQFWLKVEAVKHGVRACLCGCHRGRGRWGREGRLGRGGRSEESSAVAFFSLPTTNRHPSYTFLTFDCYSRISPICGHSTRAFPPHHPASQVSIEELEALALIEPPDLSVYGLSSSRASSPYRCSEGMGSEEGAAAQPLFQPERAALITASQRGRPLSHMDDRAAVEGRSPSRSQQSVYAEIYNRKLTSARMAARRAAEESKNQMRALEEAAAKKAGMSLRRWRRSQRMAAEERMAARAGIPVKLWRAAKRAHRKRGTLDRGPHGSPPPPPSRTPTRVSVGVAASAPSNASGHAAVMSSGIQIHQRLRQSRLSLPPNPSTGGEQAVGAAPSGGTQGGTGRGQSRRLSGDGATSTPSPSSRSSAPSSRSAVPSSTRSNAASARSSPSVTPFTTGRSSSAASGGGSTSHGGSQRSARSTANGAAAAGKGAVKASAGAPAAPQLDSLRETAWTE